MRNLLLVFAVLWLSACDSSTASSSNNTDTTRNGPAMVVRISSDGRYVISSHLNNEVVLWDINTKSKKIISNKANIYSAYFIKNSDKFLWQDLTNIVHVTSIDGKEINRFKHFPTYGHVMSSDLEQYFSSDKGWGIYKGYGNQLTTLKPSDESSFGGHGKLLNFDLSGKTANLLTAGYVYDREPRPDQTPKQAAPAEKLSYEGVVVWNTTTLKPIAKLPGNAAKTYATFSPDGKYVVSGDENVRLIVWDARSGKQLWKGEWLERKSPDQPPVPKDYIDFSHHHAIISEKFIDDSEYFLRFNTYEPFALLYKIDNPNPIKYLPLGKKPFPAVRDYARNTAIDTAPAAGILVMGQQSGSGINVYKFDKEKPELKKIWVSQ